MTDTYGGESAAKRFMRSMYWLKVREILGEGAFLQGKHLVLASREGGDLTVLGALGVKPRNILAVELNEEAAKECQAKYPEVRVVHDDVFEVAKKYKRELTSVYLDFCATMAPTLVEKVMRVGACALKRGGFLGFSCMYGREGKQSREELADLKDTIGLAHLLAGKTSCSLEQVIHELHEAAASRSRANPAGAARADALVQHVERMSEEMWEAYRVAARENGYDSGLSLQTRIHWVMEKLTRVGRGLGTLVLPQIILRYVSAREDSKGVPMLIVGGPITRASDPPGQQRKVHEDYYPTTFSLDSDFDQSALRSFILSGIADSGLSTEVAGRLFNLSPKTLIAWKAHETRGTYQKKAG